MALNPLQYSTVTVYLVVVGILSVYKTQSLHATPQLRE